jgi:uncharacterized cupin superfamily protein
VEGEQAIEREEQGGEPVTVATAAAATVAAAAAGAATGAAAAGGRPSFVKRLSEIRDQGDTFYPDHPEPHPIGRDFADEFGFKRIGVGVITLRPGQRASLPHAHSEEDELAFVLEGTPDLWSDGHVHRLGPGDVVGWPAGTGIAHTLLNDTDKDVQVLFAGDRQRPGDRVVYPVSPERQAQLEPERAWADPPKHELGPHDGKPKPR